MVKVHFRHKHIIVILSILMCFILLMALILNDIYSKGQASTKREISEAVILHEDEDIISRDFLSNYDTFQTSDTGREYNPKIQPILRKTDPDSRKIVDQEQIVRQFDDKILEPTTFEKMENSLGRLVNTSVDKFLTPFQSMSNPTMGRILAPPAIPNLDQYVTPSIEKIVSSLSNQIGPGVRHVVNTALHMITTPTPRIYSESRPMNFNEKEFSLNDHSSDGNLDRFVQSKFQDIPRTPHDSYYVAAVIDFQPLLIGDSITKVRWNVDEYVDLIKECEKYTVDIVVFPEMGIFQVHDDKESVLNIAPRIPSPRSGLVPCNEGEYDEVLPKLSCAAKDTKMYVVATTAEKFCYGSGDCSRGDMGLYLTTVVFDRTGKLIARYRKYNLDTERWLLIKIDQPSKPDYTVFTVDFNVTFGIFSSFDILFRNPAISLVKKYGVTDIIFPSDLMNRLPFLTVSSVPAGWAYAMNVNLLASCKVDLLRVGGSNIFFGRRESTTTYVTDYGLSTIVVAAVPKRGASFVRNFSDPFLSLSNYQNNRKVYTYFVEHNLGSIRMEPIFGQNQETRKTFSYLTENFFCNVSVSWEIKKSLIKQPGYRTAGYAGYNNYSLASVDNYVEMCGLMLCSWTTNLFCLLPPNFEDSTIITITSLKVTAASRVAIDDLRIPITVTSDITVLDPSYYKFQNYVKEIKGQKYNLAEMDLRKRVSGLAGFAIYKLMDKSTPLISHSVFDIVANADTVVG